MDTIIIIFCAPSYVDTQAGAQYKAQSMHSIYLAAGTFPDWLVLYCIRVFPKAIRKSVAIITCILGGMHIDITHISNLIPMPFKGQAHLFSLPTMYT